MEVSQAKKRKYPVATLCGSMRFVKEFIEAQRIFTENGYIVHGPMLWDIQSRKNDARFMIMFREMHYQKIDDADIIVVVAPDGYMGEDTREEIEYAKKNGKEIIYREVFDEYYT